MTVNPADIQGLPGEGESVGNAMMELLQDLAEGGGGGQVAAADVTVDPAVEGETNVQDALEALAIGGSTPFLPDDLTGLALWLDASHAASINAGSPADGDPVTTWADRSVAGNNAAEATSPPVYKTAILNGKAVVRFDATGGEEGSRQFLGLSGAGLDLLRDLDGFTIAAVYVNCGDGSNDYVLNVADDTGADRRALLEVPGGPGGTRTTTFGYSNTDGAEGNTSAAVSSFGTPALPITCISAIDYAHGGISVATGSPDPTTYNTSFDDTPGATPDTASFAILIGGSTIGTDGYNGDLAELLVYQRALNAQERRQVIEYLSAKWATI